MITAPILLTRVDAGRNMARSYRTADRSTPISLHAAHSL
jgi:hypothetical protein